MSGLVWRGQHGAVLLGPTEHRVAGYLEVATRDGLVTLRTMAIAERCGLARSEAYRILATLRDLGLFGISSDQGRATGGRRIWRTRATRDGRGLDPGRHRAAWARVRSWLEARRVRLARAMRGISQARLWRDVPRAGDGPTAGKPSAVRDLPARAAGPPSSLREAMRRHAPTLALEWRL